MFASSVISATTPTRHKAADKAVVTKVVTAETKVAVAMAVAKADKAAATSSPRTKVTAADKTSNHTQLQTTTSPSEPLGLRTYG